MQKLLGATDPWSKTSFQHEAHLSTEAPVDVCLRASNTAVDSCGARGCWSLGVGVAAFFSSSSIVALS
ncbi:hypothetical protein PF005_g19645 [Phytophthora fragariae]|uniref:Uncharacterized protein n=1 Tax=Phytophthora fragariae TaxID=53985 RepID=A0A6A3JAI4_9STRA|nr:hypothetical protein PF003_g38047 [Phytophthora fragariae]KAE8929418.1 hypothetical protein PF009_g20467 [Phytophthora fragariae]KAE8990418.1 hypothetical protein PF011_g18370 [Phytophthora fragariae]KAE9077156.1 hypothetical protein PF010_g23618 [Phytophthora fragariae]KAE9091302.1 hypothetical protein PF007_g18939 [Phytophthora fragariae]